MANARAKGKHIGRPETTIDDIPDRFLRYYALYQAQGFSVAELARLAGVSRQTVYKYIRLINAEKEPTKRTKNTTKKQKRKSRKIYSEMR